jgi:hypothetical protein
MEKNLSSQSRNTTITRSVFMSGGISSDKLVEISVCSRFMGLSSEAPFLQPGLV